MVAVIILLVRLILGELFTLTLQCRRGHSAWGLLRLFRYAHRGYHDKPRIPENSMAAFRRAIENGFGAELDVHLMKAVPSSPAGGPSGPTCWWRT